ncbi:MAG: FAD-dependent oxidoreductase, partial [Burkholderiaceae bacterium]
IRAITRASEAFFLGPPQGFADHPLLSQRDVVFIARDDQRESLDAMHRELAAEAPVRIMNAMEVQNRVPLLREAYAVAGLLDASGSDIDVAALHAGFLRVFKGRGGRLLTNARVRALTRRGGGWTIDIGDRQLQARVVVNAAGAWAEHVGELAGAETIGLVPKRRTAVIVAAPAGADIARLPLTVDIDEQFYLKPDAGRLLLSPANEDPQAPADAQPDEWDVAICIDRIQRAFDLDIRRVENKWAGLRSFVADKAPVVGFSDRVEGFFWLAGQGGYGVQSSPGMSRLATALLLGEPIPADIAAQGLRAEDVAPARCSSLAR